MSDLPNSGEKFIDEGQVLTRFEREENFEMMLTAVEENSGHMIILATVDWKHKLSFEVDVKRPVYSRLELTDLEVSCSSKGGYCFNTSKLLNLFFKSLLCMITFYLLFQMKCFVNYNKIYLLFSIILQIVNINQKYINNTSVLMRTILCVIK